MTSNRRRFFLAGLSIPSTTIPTRSRTEWRRELSCGDDARLLEVALVEVRDPEVDLAGRGELRRPAPSRRTTARELRGRKEVPDDVPQKSWKQAIILW